MKQESSVLTEKADLKVGSALTVLVSSPLLLVSTSSSSELESMVYSDGCEPNAEMRVREATLSIAGIKLLRRRPIRPDE